MGNYPDNLLYTKDHEWLRVEDDKGTIGITYFAQSELGDIVYIELPKAGDRLAQGEPFGSVESVKTVSELFMPVAGTIEQLNEKLADEPEIVNSDPYNDGWMMVVKIDNPSELDGLMSAIEYEELVSNNEEK